MNRKKKVTVIIPTFQRCESVKRLLKSFCHQTFPSNDYEVFICIDGSDDGTKEMLEAARAKYDLRWSWSPNSGRAAARNTGIIESRGEILIFLDDDMEPSPELIEAHYNAHKNRGRVAILGAAPITVTTNSPSVVRYLGEKFNFHLRKLSEPGYKIKIWDFYSGNFSIRRENMIEAGLFSEDFVIYGNEDVELARRFQNSEIDIVYNAQAKCIQHYEKDFASLARDTIAAGKTAVLLSTKHPDTFTELKLVEYHSVGWKWRAIRLTLIWLGIYIPGTLNAIVSFVKLFEKSSRDVQEKAYYLSLDYFYWLGVWSALRESSNGKELADKIKSRGNSSACPIQ